MKHKVFVEKHKVWILWHKLESFFLGRPTQNLFVWHETWSFGSYDTKLWIVRHKIVDRTTQIWIVQQKLKGFYLGRPIQNLDRTTQIWIIRHKFGLYNINWKASIFAVRHKIWSNEIRVKKNLKLGHLKG
jgi:hypothetical protein